MARSTTMGWSAATCVANPEVVNRLLTNTDLRAMGGTISVCSTTLPSSRKKRIWACVGTGLGFISRTQVSNGGTVEPSAKYHVFDVWRAPAAEWPACPKYIERSTYAGRSVVTIV